MFAKVKCYDYSLYEQTSVHNKIIILGDVSENI